MTPALAAAILRPEDRLAATSALALAARVISTIPDPDGRLHAGIMAAMNAVYETQKACCEIEPTNDHPVLVDGFVTPGILAEMSEVSK